MAKRRSSAHLTVLFDGGIPPGAIIISKKVAKLAVTRNRIRRRLREALRRTPHPAGTTLIVRANISDLSSREIQSELMQLLS